MCSKAEEKSKVVCKVCGSELELTEKNHYIATDVLSGPVSSLLNSQEKWYDAFDCPVCGCQYIAGERKRKVRNVIFRELQEDLVSDNVVKEDSFDVLDEPREEVCDRNPDYPLPSCFGKELKDADEFCVGCEQLGRCLHAQECFGGLTKGVRIPRRCYGCAPSVRGACRRVNISLNVLEEQLEEPSDEVLEKEIALAKKQDEEKSYPLCIGDEALIEDADEECRACASREECIRRINEAREQKEEKWEESMEMPNEF